MDKIERARTLIADGDYDGALHEYEAAARKRPGDERALCGKALVYIITNERGKAAKCMRAALRRSSDAAYPHGIMGVIAEEAGDLEDAANCYDAAVRADPSEAAAYVRKARILLGGGLEKECSEAIRECAENADLKDQTPVANERLHAMFEHARAGQAPPFKMSDFVVFVPGLQELLDRAVGDRLPFSDGLDLDAASLGTAVERYEAVKMAGKMLKGHPNWSEAQCVMGDILYGLGRADKAMACYERAIKKDPGKMLCYGYKLVMLQDSGDRAGVARCVDEALEAAPKSGDDAAMQEKMRLWRDLLRAGRGAWFAVGGNATAAVRHLARRRKRAADAAAPSADDPSGPGYILAEIQKMAEAGDHEGAIRTYERMLKLSKRVDEQIARRQERKRRAARRRLRRPPGPPGADGPLARAAQMLASGKLAGARREYEAAQKQSPDDERALCGMTLAFACSRQRDKVLECANKILAARPGAAYPHGVIGTVLHEWGFLEGALARYDKVLSADPGEVSACARKAEILQVMGMEQECSDTVAACLEASWSGRESPKEERRLREMADSMDDGGPVAFKTGDGGTFFPGLWEMLEVALGPDPGRAAPGGEPDFEGIRLAGAGNLQECIAWIDATVKGHPRPARLLCMKAAALLEAGRAGEALACYGRAAEIEPGETLAYAGKADLLADEGDLDGARECVEAALAAKARDKSRAKMQESLRNARGMLEDNGEWPAIRPSAVMPDLIRWAAGRRAKDLAEKQSQDSEGPLFPPGLVDGAG